MHKRDKIHPTTPTPTPTPMSSRQKPILILVVQATSLPGKKDTLWKRLTWFPLVHPPRKLELNFLSVMVMDLMVESLVILSLSLFDFPLILAQARLEFCSVVDFVELWLDAFVQGERNYFLKKKKRKKRKERES